MSADRLRGAARVLRERAEAVTDWSGSGEAMSVSHAIHDQIETEASTYIATVHPGVGLALADWLDATARELDSLGDPDLTAHPKDGRRTAGLAEGELHVLAEFERWADTGVNTHVGLKRRVVAAAVSKGLLVEVAPRDPDEAIRFEITVAGRRVLAAWQRKTRRPARPGRLW